MPYRTQSPDTSEAAERIQFECLRRMGRRERVERALARVDESLAVMWRALRRLHPEMNEEQLQIEWIRVHHGEELARRVEEFRRCHPKNENTATPSGA